jgi:transporter family protein
MVYQALGGVLVGLVVLISLKFQVQFNIPGFTLSLAIGILGFFGAFMYLVAVSRGPLTLVAPVTALYPMIAILLGIIFFQEALSIKQGIGIALSLVSIYLIST